MHKHVLINLLKTDSEEKVLKEIQEKNCIKF